MATYPTSTNYLRFDDSPNVIEVAAISNEQTVESFSIDENQLKISVVSSYYNLSRESCSGCYTEVFNVAEGDTFSFSERTGGIGIIDVRIEKASVTYTYHLDACPVTLEYVDGVVTVKSPCTGQCQAPAQGCRTIS